MTRHQQLKLLFDNYSIQYQEHIMYMNRLYDFKIDDTYILIALTAQYNMYFVPLSEPISKSYFKDVSNSFSTICKHLFIVWDWDDLSKIASMFKHKKKLRASNCVIKAITASEAEEFINAYHLQGTCRGQTIRLGLYTKDNELIQIMTFGKPRYNKNYEYELLRLCTKTGYIVYGGAQKLFNYFYYKYLPQSIISYCDCSKFTGKVYTSLGFVHRPASPSIHWVRIKPYQHITDNLLRCKGADNLLGTTFGKGTSNTEIMLGAGFLPVPDCGQDVYTTTFEIV